HSYPSWPELPNQKQSAKPLVLNSSVPSNAQLPVCWKMHQKVPPWTSWFKAPCTQTLWNPVVDLVPQTSRATTTSVDCQTTWNSSSLSHCATCSRTKFVPLAVNLACLRKSLAASHSQDQDLVSASSVKSPKS